MILRELSVVHAEEEFANSDIYPVPKHFYFKLFVNMG